MKIAQVAASLSRAGGGMFEVELGLSQALARLGHEVQAFGLRDEFSDDDASRWRPVRADVSPRIGPAAYGYSPRLKQSLFAANLDVAHVHGLWMYPTRAVSQWARQTGKPYLITTHGMLDPWALHNSRWKKRVVAALVEDKVLRDAACLHAFTLAELKSLRDYGLKNPVCVVPNGVKTDVVKQPPAPAWAATIPAGRAVLLYLGRIHRKKGLLNLLAAWAMMPKVKREKISNWQLVIAGWDQENHLAELEGSVRNLGLEESVTFVGSQFDGDKAKSYHQAAAVILPSVSEGLPMSVLEAWSYGKPVLMTPQCNLAEGFASRAAISIEPNPESIVSGLTTLMEMSEVEREEMGQRGWDLVEQSFTWEKVAEEMSAVYAWMLGLRDPPASVRFAD